MSKRILLTGATGGLGRMILPRLIEEGHTVTCIARPKGTLSALDRIAEIVPSMRNICVLEGDVRSPLCGIQPGSVPTTRRFAPNMLLHAAADIRFDPACESEIIETNCLGTTNALSLALVLGIRDVQYVGTVYVAGNARDFTEDDVSLGQLLRNPYESSKLESESHVENWIDRLGGGRKARILRSSILIGCSNGHTTSFDAFYGYFFRLHAIAQSMRDRAAAGGELPAGVAVAQDGTVDIPLVLVASPFSTLNMVPLDWYADMLVKVLSVPSTKKVDRLHFVHPNPPRVRWVIETSLRALKIRGVRIVETIEEQTKLALGLAPLLRKLQGRVDDVHRQYFPYVTHGTRFVSRRLERLLGNQYYAPPNIDEAYLVRLLDFAVETNWGHPVVKKRELELA